MRKKTRSGGTLGQRSGVQILDDDGITVPGQIIKLDNILINKESPVMTKSSPNAEETCHYKPTPLKHSGSAGQVAVVDRVTLSSDRQGNQNIKLIIRETRRPEVGDKFSSRHGQKGVCGTIVQQEDFPFSELGICPDLIINPHGFPSRMTVSKMIELLGVKLEFNVEDSTMEVLLVSQAVMRTLLMP